MEYEHITHSFEPIYNEYSEILILGTLPSVKSRENNFYYGHKQNRFWKLLAKLCEEETPQTVEEKTAMLLRHHIAIWDVIQSCDIKGSSDSSIKNVTPTDLKQILDHCQIRQIYANGNKAGALYKKYQQLGCNHIELKLYQDDRHELVNELDREVVYADISQWILRWSPYKA